MVLKADIHMHSVASDGGYEPSGLMKKCALAGLDLVALTDHDTTDGLKNARQTAEQHGMRFINGIELSTRTGGQSVDILGYGIDIENRRLQETLSFHRQMREERMERMVKKCQAYGLNVTMEDVKNQVTGSTWSRPHLAKALIKNKEAGTVGEVFDKFIGYGRPCYVTKQDEMTPAEAIQLVQQAGGVAVVAHPVYYNLDEQIYQWFCKCNLDGIEVYHRDHDRKSVRRFLNVAERAENAIGRPVFKTGGSDFHHESFGRPGEELGLTKLPGEEAEKLWNYLHDKEL